VVVHCSGDSGSPRASGITRHVTPCATATITQASSVTVITPDGLALLCTGQGFTGHSVKTVYTSSNLGAT